MGYPEQLPDDASLGELGHTTDHNQLVDAIRSIDDRLYAVEIADPEGLSVQGVATWATINAISSPAQGDLWVLKAAASGAPLRDGGAVAVAGDGIVFGDSGWINVGALRGPQGLTGPTGPAGAAGAASTVPGPTGPTGPAGPLSPSNALTITPPAAVGGVSTVNLYSAISPSGDYAKNPHIRLPLTANTVINLNGPTSSLDGKDIKLRLTIIQDSVGRSVKFNNVAATLPHMHKVSRKPYAVTTLELVWNATANQSRKRWTVVNLTSRDGWLEYEEATSVDNFFWHPDLSSGSAEVVDNFAGWTNLPSSIKTRLASVGVTMLVVAPGSTTFNAYDIPSWYWDGTDGSGVGGYYAGPGHQTNDRPMVVSLSGQWPMVHELGHAIDWNFHNGVDVTRSLVGTTTTASVTNITAHPEWTALYNRLVSTAGTPSSYAKTNAVEFFAEVMLARYGADVLFTGGGDADGLAWLRRTILGATEGADSTGTIFRDVKLFLQNLYNTTDGTGHKLPVSPYSGGW